MFLNTWTPAESREERKRKREGGFWRESVAWTRIESGLEEKEGVAAMATAHVGILWTCTAECEARDRMIGWQILYL